MLFIYLRFFHTVVLVCIHTMKTTFDLNFRFLLSFQTAWIDTQKHGKKEKLSIKSISLFNLMKAWFGNSSSLDWYKCRPLYTIVSVKLNISFYCYFRRYKNSYLLLDKEIDRKIDVTAILFLLVQNRHWTLIGSGADGLGIQECELHSLFFCFIIVL